MQNANAYNNIVFPDKNLKIISASNTVSSIDNKDTLSKMFHEDIEIKLFYEGSSTLIIGDKTIITTPGDVVIINPYEFHSTINAGETKGKYHLIMIGLDFFESDSTKLLDLRHIFIKDRTKLNSLIRDNPYINQLINKIVAELDDKKPLYEKIIYALVLELFSLLLRDYKDDEILDLPEGKNVRYYELIYPAIRKIRRDYAENISIDYLASLCNVSKYHFCRIFKAVTSLSAIQYQTEYRLQVADIYLTNSDKTISEISALCGFDDVSYFSRCYKKHMGMSPQQKRAILSK